MTQQQIAQTRRLAIEGWRKTAEEGDCVVLYRQSTDEYCEVMPSGEVRIMEDED